MNDNRYAKAYTEVLEIISHFPKEEYAKIPVEKIAFYKHHMDKNYIFTINPEMDLAAQLISPEANAIIVNLFTDYFATEEEKLRIKEILDWNQKKEEENKRKKYNPDDIFKKLNKHTITQIKTVENENALVEYKESFFTKFKNFIFRILHMNQ